MSELVDAWRAGYVPMALAKMAADASWRNRETVEHGVPLQTESVDAPLEEDAEGICVEGCSGPGSPLCKCEGNVAEPGSW